MFEFVLFDVELWCTDFGGSGESGEPRIETERESERDDRNGYAALSDVPHHALK